MKGCRKTKPPPSRWGFRTNISGFSMARSTASELSKLHKPAKHFLSFAMSCSFSRNLNVKNKYGGCMEGEGKQIIQIDKQQQYRNDQLDSFKN